MKQAREWKGQIAIKFPYNQETVAQVKSFYYKDWEYHPKGKYWTCKLKVEYIQKLQEWGFELDGTLIEILMDHKVKELEQLQRVENFQEITEIPGLKKTPFPFQMDGVNFMELKDGRVFIGDEMGLGKTIQALAYLQLHPEKAPVVIICPASLMLNWYKEIRDTTTNRRVKILQGKKSEPLLNSDIIIVNYDVLYYWVDALKAINPQVIITDEAHYYKNSRAKRTKAIKSLAKQVPHFIALSGTPIVNRPIEMYNALSIIDKDAVPSFWDYARKYCGAKHNGFGWDFSGATNTEELHEVLTNSVMIRRKKKDVLKDLPDKIRGFIPFSIDNSAEYSKAEGDFINYVKETKGEKAAAKASSAEVLSQIESLKQIAVKGKMEAAIEWIRDFLETGEKLVLFAVHKAVINRIMDEFGNVAVKIDGSVSAKDRDLAATRFQEDERTLLFVGNIKAAGVGLTLTRASNVAFLELPWSPGDLDQAEDRCHRIGQKDSVNIHYLLANGTIESDLAQLLDKKRKVLDSVLDGAVTAEESLLTEIINQTLGR